MACSQRIINYYLNSVISIKKIGRKKIQLNHLHAKEKPFLFQFNSLVIYLVFRNEVKAKSEKLRKMQEFILTEAKNIKAKGLKPTTSDVLNHTITIAPWLKINAQNVREGISRKGTSRNKNITSPLDLSEPFCTFLKLKQEFMKQEEKWT